jgi:hypothetical protein
MFAPSITPERPWPCRPAAPRRARPPAGTVRLARAAARRLLAALDDRMLRDLDLGWDTIEPARAAGRT